MKNLRQMFSCRGGNGAASRISGLLLATALGFGLMMGCDSEKSSAPTAPDASNSSQATCAVAAKTVLGYTNYERCLQGIAPLAQNSLLDAAAQGHSDAMVKQKFLDHTNPYAGSSPMDRVTAAGYAWSFVGENIARGPNSPKIVVASWMASDEHRAHILNPVFVDMGIGVNGITWTQIFAAP